MKFAQRQLSRNQFCAKWEINFSFAIEFFELFTIKFDVAVEASTEFLYGYHIWYQFHIEMVKEFWHVKPRDS